MWVDGEGPLLGMVRGSPDHSRFDTLVAELRDAVTIFAMDRRSFGASGDAAGYSIERELEHVTAVGDAAGTGGPVAVEPFLRRHCAMGGAALTNKVHHLVLYEPSGGLPYPAGSSEAVEEALAAGDREAAIVLVFERHWGLLDGDPAVVTTEGLVALVFTWWAPRNCLTARVTMQASSCAGRTWPCLEQVVTASGGAEVKNLGDGASGGSSPQ